MKNEAFERRLYEEIIVDCRDEYEQRMSWFYFVQDEMCFPFEAKIELRKRGGGKILKKVNVIDLSSDYTNSERIFDLKVAVELEDYIIEIPLAKLIEANGTEETNEVIEIWEYWIQK